MSGFQFPESLIVSGTNDSEEESPPGLTTARTHIQGLRIIQWNVSSLKRETYQVIRELQPHVLFFQETRRKMDNTPAYNYISRIRADPGEHNSRQGGGVAIGVSKSLTFRDLADTVPPALQSLELVFVQVVHELFELYALNVYLPRYKEQGKMLPALQQWLLEVRAKKPDAIFIVAGDFNTD